MDLPLFLVIYYSLEYFIGVKEIAIVRRLK